MFIVIAGKDSPSSKLLYAKDIPIYKDWVTRYYQVGIYSLKGLPMKLCFCWIHIRIFSLGPSPDLTLLKGLSFFFFF
jgi:Plexin cytoplasmic RasGAP domain